VEGVQKDCERLDDGMAAGWDGIFAEGIRYRDESTQHILFNSLMANAYVPIHLKWTVINKYHSFAIEENE